MTIPKIIHQIWFQGKDNIPEFHEKYQNICKKMYPTWKYMFWDNHLIRKFIKKNYYHLLYYYEYFPYLIQKVDLARYIILYHYGGCYIDMDVECLKPIDNLLLQYPKKEFICSEIVPSIWFQIKHFAYKKFTNNGTIISTKQNPIISKLINEKNIKTSYKQDWWKITKEIYISHSTGIDYFNKHINKSFLDDTINEKLLILPYQYFEPSMWGTKTFKVSYFNHHHQLSWCSNNFKNSLQFLFKWKFSIFFISIIILLLIIGNSL